MIDRLKILSILFLMFLIMVFVEVTLELRHFNMGYETLLFGSKKTITSGINAAQKQKIKGYGPSNEFPFRSLLIDMAAVGKTRIWIASSSHAEHNSLPAEKIFPNLICAAVNISAQCELINGSKAGMGIDGNLKLLSQYAIQYGVDYALL